MHLGTWQHSAVLNTSISGFKVMELEVDEETCSLRIKLVVGRACLVGWFPCVGPRSSMKLRDSAVKVRFLLTIYTFIFQS